MGRIPALGLAQPLALILMATQTVDARNCSTHVRVLDLAHPQSVLTAL